MATTGVIELEKTCIMCPRRGTRVCTNCKDARYCSTDCQKVDWKHHKILCPTFNQEKPPITRSNAFHRRALFYPGGDQKARFVWVEIWTEREGTYAVWDQLDLGAYLGGATGACDYFSDPNPIQARRFMRDDTEFGLLYWCKDPNDAEPPNLGLRACTRGRACAPNFRGPILVMRKVEFGAGKERYVGIDMRDARTAADCFSYEYRDGTSKMQHLEDQRVLVTSCACPQLVARLNLPTKYFAHVLDGCDSVFAAGGSGIANLLGIPLSLRLMQSFQPTGNEANRNTAARLLMLDITSTTIGPIARGDRYINREFRGMNGFGSSGDLWSGDTVGTVLTARADGLPLLARHVEALCNYIETRIEPKLAAVISGLSPGDVVRDRECILNSITKADFLDFFNAMKATRAATDVEWRDLLSPYDVTRASHAVDIAYIWHGQTASAIPQQSDMPRQRILMVQP
ncbi:hypothetical protein LTR10_019140 [Elasticomyces elasticus]|uniref:MYND-type domain-containing protein n=1 Tax=Exophiala sideris TaxID=1016849 RepID=A0ABR0JHJ8_9EURO|nr:hypothetical protein LTR10_019140 [Elasticomyces elasticus]KAK5033452.1 hypothetical protein LTS07_003755 [Exophiala sideris]KAK5042053.1 hypothetical protein LTR13_001859 [Exophiala sideris]KAK5063996.1 hypothetical protein LTR69_003763 [Exophiala sideris]KAK5185321.1 hypothetical protein LTR44_002310 [Eurotiomycetes sp. CCFEE 6388]